MPEAIDCDPIPSKFVAPSDELDGICEQCGLAYRKASKFKRKCDTCIKTNNRIRGKKWEDKSRVPLKCMLCDEVTKRTSSRQKTCIDCRPKFRLQVTLEWQKKNPDKVKSARRKTYENRRSSVTVRINDAMSRAIGRSISTKKDSSWHELVGYSAEDLVDHLSKQFQRGMTLENYGEWEIDHIIPLKSFSFSEADTPEFKFCWGLPNLRPVWQSKNRSKSGKRIFLI